MSTARSLKRSLQVNIKQEQNDEITEDDESEETDEDDDSSDSSSDLLPPSILDKDCLSTKDLKDEFLQLTSMVRRVYFSYLHKSIINNYNVCYTAKDKRNISRTDLKKFASRLELYAVTASLEASLYRQAMLKIIADIKSNTEVYQVHAELAKFMNSPPKTTDAAVQTCLLGERTDKSISCDQTDLDSRPLPPVNTTEDLQNNSDDRVMDILGFNDTSCTEVENVNDQPDGEVPTECEQKIRDVNASVKEIFGDFNDDPNATLHDEDSRDSLLQHMEDMFCESDEDSNDLMALIEKHSGVSKSNLDIEIGKMCQEAPTAVKKNPVKIVKRECTPANTSETLKTGVKRKVSFKNYKKMKKLAAQGVDNLDPSQNLEDKQTKKMRGIWFVERVHQVSKLKKKMMELSVRNYRKHGRVRAKFHTLFGDLDEEEMMPESPIHIEEHLTACKERIAPWVVKYLMPYYTKKLIKDRLLFKAVAKHIADMLIIENTFPEEDCVSQYVKDYFRNKTGINAEADIYM